MNIFKKFSDLSHNVVERIREDITSEAYHMSKSEFYDQYFPKNYDNTITYMVQYHGVDTTTSWGPFTTIESANQWCNKIFSAYSVECDVVYINNPKSNPDTWFM